MKKRLLSILLAAVMILSVASFLSLTVAAEQYYHDGDPCPNCGGELDDCSSCTPADDENCRHVVICWDCYHEYPTDETEPHHFASYSPGVCSYCQYVCKHPGQTGTTCSICYANLPLKITVFNEHWEWGSILTDETAEEGDTVYVSVDPQDGCHLKSLKYNDGEDHEITENGGDYKFTMPAASVTVTVEFEPDHVHVGDPHKGYKESEESAGYRDYYVCDCGLYFEDEDCTVLIGDEAAFDAWKTTGAGMIPQLTHDYDENHRCKNCHDIEQEYLLDRDTAINLLRAKYKSGSNELDFATVGDGDYYLNGVAQGPVQGMKYYRIGNTIYVIFGGSSHAKLMTAEMDGDKVTKLTTYDIMTEEVTGVYAPDNGGSGNGNGGNGEGGDPTDPGDTAGPNLWWLWVLIAIIVICGGGAAYYFFVYKKKKAE